jgi:hypothetical protein
MRKEEQQWHSPLLLCVELRWVLHAAESGAPGTRTQNLTVKSRLLYH